MIKKLGTAAALLLLIGCTACYNDKANELYPSPSTGCDTANVTYSGTLKPIVMQSCATTGCHAGSAAPNGLDFTTIGKLQSEAANGNLSNAIHHTGSVAAMPQGGAKMDDCTLAKFDIWIKAGAPNN